MRARRRQQVDDVLHVVSGHEIPGPDGSHEFVYQPRATYRCLRCGHTDHAEGRALVPAFVASIRTDHRATCPAIHRERS